MRMCLLLGALASVLTGAVHAQAGQNAERLVTYRIIDGTIPSPLTPQPGDPERGRQVVLDRERGDCVVCHALPLPERQFHGSLGPPLDGVGSRSSAGALRLRLVNPKAFNSDSVMPAYYQADGFSQVLAKYRGKPILTAQEIEDIVAYLKKVGARLPRPYTSGHGDPPLPFGAMTPKLSSPSASYSLENRRSGYTYLSPDNQQLQTDDFANPGMLWVERGQAAWRQIEGEARSSCQTCHGAAAESMRGVRARYPRFDTRSQKLINLEEQIGRCRVEQMRAASYPYESEALLALTTFIGLQSRGMPIAVEVDGPARPFFEAGKAFFLRRRGQLDLACTHCHDQHAGRQLRGEVISQGQTNGFPIYRHLWQTLGSTHRMFAWCNVAVRAEPLPLGADEYVNLELYQAWRGRGLPVETPAVRR
ncbi:MAG: sulfur oxidation c-type cytochrome SoxA [Deltaproteobacteria bacterium]|nr:sulfur oxidation c-type cytochrome SoxA [Deltaproteobacteria bacterium]